MRPVDYRNLYDELSRYIFWYGRDENGEADHDFATDGIKYGSMTAEVN